MTGGRVHTDFTVGAIIKSDFKVVDKKAEIRKKEFESFWNTMYPVCNKFASFMVSNSTSKQIGKDDAILATNFTINFMQMALQIWCVKLARNQ